MKRFNSYALRFVLAILLTSILSSCGVKRFFFLKGYNIWSNDRHSHRKNIEPVIVNAVKFNRDKRSVHSENACKAETSMPLACNALETGKTKSSVKLRDLRVSVVKELVIQKKQELKTFFPPPDKNLSKHKISVSQINGLAMISLAMAPLFILSLIIGPAWFVYSTLILGIGLGTLCGFLADGRKGCFMVSIAIGFWIIILAYLTLIIILSL